MNIKFLFCMYRMKNKDKNIRKKNISLKSHYEKIKILTQEVFNIYTYLTT